MLKERNHKKGVKQLLNKWTAVLLLICMTVGIVQLPGSYAEAQESTVPSLRAAILSDVHMGDANCKDGKWFEYVLKWYKQQNVNAVIIAGDLADATNDATLAGEQIQKFFDVWNSVFPKEDGVEPIFIYGNHDTKLSASDANAETNYWETNLGEEFSPVYTKEVGGYQFVCVHDGFEASNKELIKEKVDAAVAASNGAPVFYVQHSALYQTTGGSDGSEYGDVMTGFDVIKDYENVVALTGHTHRSIVNDANIWQGDDWNEGKFTTISCSTLSYGSFEDADYHGNNLYPNDDSVKTKQGLIMNASGNNINVERYSFYTDEMVGLVEGTDAEQDYANCAVLVGEDWEFTVGGEKPYTFNKRYEESIVPEFSENDDLFETCTTGYSFFNAGDTVYTHHESFEKDGRNALKMTRAAKVTTVYPYTQPTVVVNLTDGVSLTEDTYISLDAWFSAYAHTWVNISLCDNNWSSVGSVSYDYPRHESWETFRVQVKDMNLKADLSTVTKITVAFNVEKNAEYDTEFYFDNLKLLNTHVECSDTSATVVFPSASMSDGSMFKDYVVEARDVNSGVIKATATVNTEYRIDKDIASRYRDSYSVDINGLLQDTTYDFYVYGRNFYGKCSTEPLVLTAKTTGTRTSNGDEKGDVNNDFYTDVRDLVALKANGTTAKNTDVDENGIVDAEVDKNGLYRILLGYTSVVQDSEKDLIGQSTYQSGTKVVGKKGFGIQTAEVNDKNFTDSKAAYEVWATADGIGTDRGIATKIWFDEAQDWSKTNYFRFDVLSKDNCTSERLYEICLISGEQNVLSNKISYYAKNNQWETNTIAQERFTNVDWRNVKGIRFYVIFENVNDRYTGVDKSSFFIDNMYASYIDDLLETCPIQYVGYSNTNSNYINADGLCVKDGRNALKFFGAKKTTLDGVWGDPYFLVTLPSDMVLTEDQYICLDAWFNTNTRANITVAFWNSDGNLCGESFTTGLSVDYSHAINTWGNALIKVSDIKLLDGYSLSDVAKIVIHTHIQGVLNGDVEYYFDNLKICDIPYILDGLYYDPATEINQGCTVQPVLGPIYGKEGDIFTKFVGGSWSGSPRINIKDSDFKNGLTAADSVSFWVYAPTQTGNVASLKLRLCDIYHGVIRNDFDITFDTWTKITLTGEEMQKYISGSGLMIWAFTTQKEAGGGDRYLELYLSDIEITKGTN